ncbi:radical SAM protein [bacterium]|nr:radical SAM protein [bacterium]
MARLLEKVKLLQGLLSGDTAYVGPFYVNVDITHRCNLRCRWCRWHSPILSKPSEHKLPIRDFPLDVFRKMCGELKTMGTHMLLFVGAGEPLLHPNILDMISAAKENGLGVTIYTNGTLLTERRITSLIDTHVDSLRVSLWATSSEDYAQQHPDVAPSRFQKIIDGLQLLLRLKTERGSRLPRIEFSHAINRQSLRKLDGLVDLACATGCEKIVFSVVQAAEGGEDFKQFLLSPDEERLACLSLDQVKRRLNSLSIQHNVEEVSLRYRLGESGWKTTPCYAAWYYAFCRIDGKVQPCQRCHMPMGDLRENSFQEIWNSRNYRHFRTQSVTYQGLAAMMDYCDCSFCPHIARNEGIKRFFRWFSPFRMKR